MIELITAKFPDIAPHGQLGQLLVTCHVVAREKNRYRLNLR